MAIDDDLQRGKYPVQVRLRIQCEQDRQDVGVCLAVQQVMEQNAFLQWRERINILDVFHSARNGPGNAVDMRLLKLDQWQHVWRNQLAARWNEIWRRNGLRLPFGLRCKTDGHH